MKTLVVLCGTLAIAFFSITIQAECEVNENGYVTISGDYTSMLSGAEQGMTAYIIQKGKSLTLINGGGGVTTTGTLSLLKVTVPEWSLTGTLQNNCREIVWSNSTVWLRKN